MKKTLKTILFLAATFAAGMAFAQEAGPAPDHHGHFSNKLSSDIVNVNINSGDVTFAGFKNKASVDVLSGRVDVGITASFTFKEITGSTGDYTYYSLGNGSVGGFTLDDWYIEFRPLKNPNFFTIGFHDTINIAGSYLPVEDDNFANGNMGSDVVAVLRPIQGVRIAAGFDLDSYFGCKEDLVNQYPVLNLGMDWTYGDLFSIGFALRNPINAQGDNNDLGFGAGATFRATENLKFYAGYSFNDPNGIANLEGQNLITFAATANVSLVSFAADFAAALPAEESKGSNEIYLALDADASVTKKLDTGLTARVWLDTNDDAENIYEINPYVNLSLKPYQLGAGLNFIITESTATVSFPVYCKVSF